MHTMDFRTLAAGSFMMPCEGCVFPSSRASAVNYVSLFCLWAQVPAYSPYVVERYFSSLNSRRRVVFFLVIRCCPFNDWNVPCCRFQRCLDLYLCPRVAKNRLKIQPNEILPPLPSPQVLHNLFLHFFSRCAWNAFCYAQELKPFPSLRCLKYMGHTVWRCSVHILIQLRYKLRNPERSICILHWWRGHYSTDKVLSIAVDPTGCVLHRYKTTQSKLYCVLVYSSLLFSMQPMAFIWFCRLFYAKVGGNNVPLTRVQNDFYVYRFALRPKTYRVVNLRRLRRVVVSENGSLTTLSSVWTGGVIFILSVS